MRLLCQTEVDRVTLQKEYKFDLKICYLYLLGSGEIAITSIHIYTHIHNTHTHIYIIHITKPLAYAGSFRKIFLQKSPWCLINIIFVNV